MPPTSKMVYSVGPGSEFDPTELTSEFLGIHLEQSVNEDEWKSSMIIMHREASWSEEMALRYITLSRPRPPASSSEELMELSQCSIEVICMTIAHASGGNTPHGIQCSGWNACSS